LNTTIVRVVHVFTSNLCPYDKIFGASLRIIFTTSQKVKPHDMKIFQKYLMMWHEICSKDSFLFLWTHSLVNSFTTRCSPVSAIVKECDNDVLMLRNGCVNGMWFIFLLPFFIVFFKYLNRCYGPMWHTLTTRANQRKHSFKKIPLYLLAWML
jgi:hypothetical protein